MQLIVGLGNPGGKYAANRHNIGFMAVDRLAEYYRFPGWRKGFQAEIAEGTIAGERVMLMKPQTYMNESGRAVGEAARFHKIEPTEIIVLHDELDLPPGKVRMKAGGGHGGHNGLRSITAHIGDSYRRMRLGIGHPGVKELVHAHVLGDFAKADRDWLDKLFDTLADNAEWLVKGEDATFANRVHLAIEPKKPKAAKPEADASAAAPSSAPAAREADKAPTALADQLRRLLERKK